MKHRIWSNSAAAAAWLLASGFGLAEDAQPEKVVGAPQPKTQSGSPEQVDEKEFEELKTNSPFTRSLNLSDSLVLTGVMNWGELTTATIRNAESQEIYVVSADANTNPEGWKMESVTVDPDNPNDLSKMTANILLAGGAKVQVRFDENRIKPEAKPAAGGGPGGPGSGKGGKGDGQRGFGPPPEVMAKLRTLNDEQRKKLGEYMQRIRQENPNISREDMRSQFYKAVERLGAGGGGGGGSNGSGGGGRDGGGRGR